MSAVKSSNTYWANIYVGIKDNQLASTKSLRSYLISYIVTATAWGLCVTVQSTTYIYTDGEEVGYVVGLINYPRFPKSDSDIFAMALEIAETLKGLYKQKAGNYRYTTSYNYDRRIIC